MQAREDASNQVVLGIVDGLHDAGAAVVAGGRILAAALMPAARQSLRISTVVCRGVLITARSIS